MDYETLSDEQFLDQGIAYMTDLHRRIAAYPEGGVKTSADRHALVIHEMFERMWDRLGTAGVVRPMDGTDKPPP